MEDVTIVNSHNNMPLPADTKNNGSVIEQEVETEQVLSYDLQNPDTADKQPEEPKSSNLSESETGSNVSELNTSKKSKRVTFPDEVILGYHEPAIPWNNVSECSTEELIAAYKKSCAKHDVKPLPKLLQQLNVITNFHERNETITFRGENLNIRHCETLEEILRRVQFRTIDLEASHLDEECAIAVFDMIEYYQAAIRVNISYNKIGFRGWQACARMLKKTHCLEHLDARSCSLTEQILPTLGRSLRMGSVLKILHLENSIMSGRSLMILVAALKLNDLLEELFLADNKLMPSDGIQLGNFLKFNHKLRLLDVRNNHLGDVGMGHVCDGMSEQISDTGLQTLVLWNNQITYQSMNALGRALKTARNLETLNLGHNNITNEGIHRLKEGLMQNNSLLRIGLQAAKIFCEGAVALAECIAESPRLVRLDLRENEIKTAGLMALSLSLKVNQSVQRIDIDQSPKKESGVKDYADQQRRLLQDITNYSQRNRDVAAQKEQEEKQKKLEAELQAAMKETDDEEEVQESLKEGEDVKENPPEVSAQNDNIQEKPNVSVETNEKPNEEEHKENSDIQQMRMQLDLPLVSRSQSLDSPVDAPEISYPPLKIPQTVPEKEPVGVEKHESPILQEYPPSPMVSAEGKTVHADGSVVPAIPLLMEPTKIDENPQNEDTNKQNDSGSTEPVVSGEQSPPVQGNNLSPVHNKGGLMPAKSPSPTRSPNSKRRFFISKVVEHSSPTTGSTSASTELSNGADTAMSDTGSNVPVLGLENEETLQQEVNTDRNIDAVVSNLVNTLVSDAVKIACNTMDTTENDENLQTGNMLPDNHCPVVISANGESIPPLQSTTSSNQEMNNQGSDLMVKVTAQGDSANQSSCDKQSDPLPVSSENCSKVDHTQNVTDTKTVKPVVKNTETEASGTESVSVSGVSQSECDISKQLDTDQNSGTAKCSSADVLTLNGINVNFEEFLEATDGLSLGSLDNGTEKGDMDLLTSADDFEKELDDMLASVQTLAFTPEAVHSESSS